MIKNGLLLLLSSLISWSCFAQLGCTDPQATNFDQNAQENDGSCSYSAATNTPLSSVLLDASLSETSGLLFWSNHWWTQNDDTETKLYEFSPTDGTVADELVIQNVTNQDWEEIAQDENYLYIGDFGNNASGNRTNLQVLRIQKATIMGQQVIDTIAFSYENQLDLTAQASNSTDFDCEAFVVGSDSIFLFTKQWNSKKTFLYGFPKTPGTFIAKLKDSLNVQGLITGATYLEDKNLLALSAYTTNLQPFAYLLYDFQGTHFFKANKRKINLNLNFHQIESIATLDGLQYYFTNERFQTTQFTTEAQFHHFDFSAYLEDYLSPSQVGLDEKEKVHIQIYPNPSSNFLTLNQLIAGENTYQIFNAEGKIIEVGTISEVKSSLDISKFERGTYTILIGNQSLKFVKE